MSWSDGGCARVHNPGKRGPVASSGCGRSSDTQAQPDWISPSNTKGPCLTTAARWRQWSDLSRIATGPPATVSSHTEGTRLDDRPPRSPSAIGSSRPEENSTALDLPPILSPKKRGRFSGAGLQIDDAPGRRRQLHSDRLGADDNAAELAGLTRIGAALVLEAFGSLSVSTVASASAGRPKPRALTDTVISCSTSRLSANSVSPPPSFATAASLR